MLSDEEKKAIEYWKKYMEILHWNTQLASEHHMSVLLNLIEKQSEEIEELKKQDLSNSKIIANMSTRHFNDREKIRKYEELQDKIKAKIEEFKTVRDTILENEKEFNRPMMTYDLKRNDYCEKMLQSLLEKE